MDNKLISKLKKLLARKQFHVAFLFTGTPEIDWALVKELYNQDESFASIMLQCSLCNVKAGGDDLLLYLSRERTLDRTDRNIVCFLLAVEISLYNYFVDEAIQHKSIMALGIGELSGLYAANAISLESVFLLANTILPQRVNSTDFSFFLVHVNNIEARRLCNALSCQVSVFYEKERKLNYIYVNAMHCNLMQEYLDRHQIVYNKCNMMPAGFHQNKDVRKYKKYVDVISNVFFNPLKCTYFSSYYGIELSSDTLLSPDYIFNGAINPCFADSMLRAALKKGCNTLVGFGSFVFSTQYIKQITTRKVDLISVGTSSISASEWPPLIAKMVKKFRKKESRQLPIYTVDGLLAFIRNFNFNEPGQLHALAYLRSNGHVHYLHNPSSFLVLSYRHIEQVLKDETIFSTESYKAIDDLLIGATGSFHQRNRSLLMPIFSSAAISAAKENATQHAGILVDDLLTRDSFDVVCDFIYPFMTKQLLDFFGLLSLGEEDTIYSIMFVGRLDRVQCIDQRTALFERFINQSAERRALGVVGFIMQLVNQGSYSKEDAIKVLGLLWDAAFETTQSLLGTLFIKVQLEQELCASMGDNMQMKTRFLDECLRLGTTIRLQRTTLDNVIVGNMVIPKGSIVLFNLYSANTDPAEFDMPFAINVNRPIKRNLAFGAGAHQCIGMSLARAIGGSVLQVLLSRIERLSTFYSDQVQYSRGDFNDVASSIPFYKSNA